MSEESDTYWVSLAEKLVGVLLIIISALMLYYTATSSDTLAAFSWLFGFLAIVVLVIGLFLLIVRPPT